jgi:hypothetical protein
VEVPPVATNDDDPNPAVAGMGTEVEKPPDAFALTLARVVPVREMATVSPAVKPEPVTPTEVPGATHGLPDTARCGADVE